MIILRMSPIIQPAAAVKFRVCLDGCNVCVKFLYHFSLLFGKIYLIMD
jgi:hypothetical protein